MEDKEYGETCWRCMTIYRKHHNVLQYKESEYLYSVFCKYVILFQATVNHTFKLSIPSVKI